MAENENVNQNQEEPKKSKREIFNERLKTKYPDREYADDEALFGQIGEDYDDYENRLGQYKEREDKMSEMFARDPRAAQFVRDMADGKDPWIAVIERVGSDGVIELMNDPEKKAAREEANAAYAEQLAKEKELEAEYEKNQAESIALREQMDAQYGEALVDEALAVIDQIFKDALVGKITKETFDLAMKVVNREAELENARSEGEIAGKNAKIEETLRQQKSGDGIPAMGGSVNSSAPQRQRQKSVLEMARDEEKGNW